MCNALCIAIGQSYRSPLSFPFFHILYFLKDTEASVCSNAYDINVHSFCSFLFYLKAATGYFFWLSFGCLVNYLAHEISEIVKIVDHIFP